VERERHVEIFECAEHALVVGIVQRAALHRVRPDHDRANPTIGNNASQLAFGQLGIV
jgi:hypothetical protein